MQPETPPDALQTRVHRRLNLLSREWVLVSPHRNARPWQGQLEPVLRPALPSRDAGCYLCPGSERAGGVRNPEYTGTFTFDNDFAALVPGGEGFATQGLLRAESENGLCRVLCYSPRHDLSFGALPLTAMREVIDTWATQYVSMCALPHIEAVTIFENRGESMGASSPHPHGQIWANATVPDEMMREGESQRAHLHAHGRCLLCEYAALEVERGERVVAINEQFVAVVPFWASWPFEVLVLPRVHAKALHEADSAGRDALARLLKELIARYDALFATTFPYSMGIHQAPASAGEGDGWHWHMHFYPPLLRSATVRKFMVGYELLAGPQRDLTPERAASLLRGEVPKSP